MMDESVIPAIGMGTRTVFARTKDTYCMFNAGINALTSHLIQHRSLCYGLKMRLPSISSPSLTALPSTPTLSAGCLNFCLFSLHMYPLSSPPLKIFSFLFKIPF